MKKGPPWQNHSRLLTEEELDEVRRAVACAHLNQEAIGLDETGRLLLSCAEALLRDIDSVHPEGLRLARKEPVDYEALDAQLDRSS